jgi:cellulose synthase/poly-beta-1,6-N-acetylglucosamine synthase-like glycosyltransferase
MWAVWWALCTGLSLAYGAILLNYLRGWRSIPFFLQNVDFQPRTRISVVIAARNEAANIEACLRSVAACGYPAALLEVVVVDDASSDATADVARRSFDFFFEKNTRTHVLPSTASGKKAALATGINATTGQLIACTDADCEVPPRWLHLLAQAHEQQQPGLIAAPVLLHREANALQRFQSLDLLGLMGVTGAGIEQGWQRMANGANMAYPRAVFEAVGGLAGYLDRASGDDMFLVQKIAAAGYPIFFLKHPDAAVRTDSPAEWGAFFEQRLRWGTKNAALPEWRVKAVLGVVFLFCWAIALSLLAGIRYPLCALLGVGMLFWKAAFDWLFLGEMSRFFGRSDLMRSFGPSFLLHTAYIVVLGSASLFFKKYRWKGRLRH